MKPAALERKLTVKALAQEWGWSTQKIYRLVNHPDPKRQIPHVRIGREVYFELSELDPWLEARRRRGRALAQPPQARSRAQECEALGIPVEHRFS